MRSSSTTRRRRTSKKEAPPPCTGTGATADYFSTLEPHAETTGAAFRTCVVARSPIPLFTRERPTMEEWSSGGLGFDFAERSLRAGAASPAARASYDALRGTLEATVSARVNARAVSAKRRRVYGEEGDEIDTARVAAGDSDCWAGRVRNAKRRTFRLGINLGLSASAGPESFATQAGALAAASSALSARGYGVEIIPLAALDYRGRTIFLLPPVKEAHEPLDVERILSLGSPAFLRCCLFPLWDGMPAEHGHPKPYGHPFDPSADERAALGLDAVFSVLWSSGDITQHADGFASELFGSEGGG